jgi:hypothetical protein
MSLHLFFRVSNAFITYILNRLGDTQHPYLSALDTEKLSGSVSSISTLDAVYNTRYIKL